MRCKGFVPRYGYFGLEQHSCPDCGELMQVCDNCGGDYHADPQIRAKCPSKRLNNTVVPEQEPIQPCGPFRS